MSKFFRLIIGVSFVFWAILLPMALSMMSCGHGQETTQTSVELINRAYEQNIIDFDTRALYLTYSIYDQEALPPEYQSNVPMKSATPIILEIQRNWDKLNPATQEKILPYIQPLETEPHLNMHRPL